MPIQIPDGLSANTLPRPSSTALTDIDDEIINGREHFRPSQQFHRTPGPYPSNRRYESGDEEDDSDPTHRHRRVKVDSQPTKLITEGTQSEEKSTRNVGTMHEPVQTRNFGNEVQAQSSSTQTSFLLKPKPAKTTFTYLERPEPPQTSFDDSYLDQRIPSRSHDMYYDQYGTIPHDLSRRRSPSPQAIDYPYDRKHPYYDTQFKDRPYHRLSPPEDYHQPEIQHRHSPSPPISYRSMTRLPQDRPPTIIYRFYTPTPSRRSRCPSPYRRPHSATPRYRPQMYSQETDTSLDAMKRRQHIGVQYEPRSTRDKGTSPSIRSTKPTTSYRQIDTSIYSQEKYPTSYSSLPRRRDHPEKNYYIRPTTTDDYQQEEEEEEEEDYDETLSMHDQSTMAELIVSLDHYTQCESQPYMADHYVQTTPTLDENEQRNLSDLLDESDIRQLPVRGSISIPQPVIIQPDTLPRTRRPQYSLARPKRDGLDYTGKILEVSLHHGQQQRSSIRESPLLNIGTEHIIQQSPTNEYTVPFETRYISDSLRSSTLRSRSNSSIIVPVLNSPRTHMFTNNPIRQSRSNGNFYLSTAPQRSLNSSFRIKITADES